MSGPEDESHRYRNPSEPSTPIALPPELAAFLATEELACITHNSDQGALYVLKAPAAELASLRGTFPIGITHELHRHPQAPVIRSVMSFYDQPDRPLKLDTFLNVGDEDQRACFASLAEQEEVVMLFYDEALAHRLSKRVRNGDPAGMRRLLAVADELRAMIPADRYDYDAAVRPVPPKPACSRGMAGSRRKEADNSVTDGG